MEFARARRLGTVRDPSHPQPPSLFEQDIMFDPHSLGTRKYHITYIRNVPRQTGSTSFKTSYISVYVDILPI